MHVFIMPATLHQRTDTPDATSHWVRGIKIHRTAIRGISLRRLEPIYRRCRMHDLIREYARSLTPMSDSAADPELAIERSLNYYQHIAQVADSHLARRSCPAATVAAISAPLAAPNVPDRDRAQEWMTTERHNVLAGIDHARSHLQHARVLSLVCSRSLPVTTETVTASSRRASGLAAGAAGHRLGAGCRISSPTAFLAHASK
jgi:hypothetical protein